MYFGPVVMLSVENVRAGDCDVLASGRYWDPVRIVLACGYRIGLARWSYTDYLNHKITVLILSVSAIREVAVGLV
jgi:hypothetical protein